MAIVSAAAIALTAWARGGDLSHPAAKWGLALLLPSLVLAAAGRDSRAVNPASGVAASWLKALNVTVLLMIVPVIYSLWPGELSTVSGWRSPFLDKRWLVTLYAIVMVGVGILPLLFEGPRAVAQPATAATPTRRGILQLAVQGMLLAGLVWYLAGPPWNVAGHVKPVDQAEQSAIGSLHAMSRGTVAFTGAASTFWGPGSQRIVHAVMSIGDRQTLAGFREGALTLHLIGMAIFGVVAWWHLGMASSLLAIAIAMLASPLAFHQSLPDGALGDAYGTASPLRFAAPLIVVPAIALIARTGRRAAAQCALLGIGWGVLAWCDQENLTSTAAGVAAIISVLYATGVASWPRIRICVSWLAIGLAATAIVIIGGYALAGGAAAFLRNYWLLPGMIRAGFANTPWMTEAPDTWGAAYRLMPVLVLLLGVTTAWDIRRRAMRSPLDTGQIRLLSFLVVLAVCYPYVLHRSDRLHLIEAIVALPIVLVLALREWPAWLADTWAWRGALRVVLAAAVLAVLPIGPRMLDLYSHVLRPPLDRFRARPAAPATDPSLEALLSDARELKALVGDRATYVQAGGPYRPGFVAFAADLRPAPLLLTDALILNDRMQHEAWRFFEARVSDVECLIATSLDSVEARAFMAAHPSATATPRRLGAATVLVIMKGAPGTQ